MFFIEHSFKNMLCQFKICICRWSKYLYRICLSQFEPDGSFFHHMTCLCHQGIIIINLLSLVLQPADYMFNHIMVQRLNVTQSSQVHKLDFRNDRCITASAAIFTQKGPSTQEQSESELIRPMTFFPWTRVQPLFPQANRNLFFSSD